jgi:hypothetical protein
MMPRLAISFEDASPAILEKTRRGSASRASGCARGWCARSSAIAGDVPERARYEAPKRLPLLERRVAYREVDERVFRRTCWHCYSNAELADGDGGPGNTGGFGFPGRGLSFASYAEVSEGSVGPDGERRSIFPALVDILIARQVEEAGGTVEGVRGMPLGLPALGAEEVQLIESWIAQGRPRS